MSVALNTGMYVSDADEAVDLKGRYLVSRSSLSAFIDCCST